MHTEQVLNVAEDLNSDLNALEHSIESVDGSIILYKRNIESNTRMLNDLLNADLSEVHGAIKLAAPSLGSYRGRVRRERVKSRHHNIRRCRNRIHNNLKHIETDRGKLDRYYKTRNKILATEYRRDKKVTVIDRSDIKAGLDRLDFLWKNSVVLTNDTIHVGLYFKPFTIQVMEEGYDSILNEVQAYPTYVCFKFRNTLGGSCDWSLDRHSTSAVYSYMDSRIRMFGTPNVYIGSYPHYGCYGRAIGLLDQCARAFDIVSFVQVFFEYMRTANISDIGTCYEHWTKHEHEIPDPDELTVLHYRHYIKRGENVFDNDTTKRLAWLEERHCYLPHKILPYIESLSDEQCSELRVYGICSSDTLRDAERIITNKSRDALWTAMGQHFEYLFQGIDKSEITTERMVYNIKSTLCVFVKPLEENND